MTNFLEWGADWLKDICTEHTEVDVTVLTDSGSVSLTASLVDEQGRFLPGNLPLKTENTRFMFKVEDIASNGIVFKSSTRITYAETVYDVVRQGNRFWVYNDVFKKHIVIDAQITNR